MVRLLRYIDLLLNKKMTKITYLSEILNDGTKDTPLQVLEQVKERIESGQQDPTKLVVISLNDRSGQYDVRWQQAGMSMSQLVALLEIAKMTMISKMGY